MKRFFKLFGAGAASFGLFYKPAWKAFAIDELGEGIDIEKVPDSIQQDVSDIAIFSVSKERELANDIALNFNAKLGKIQVAQLEDVLETSINIMESVRSKRVFLICSFDTNRWSFNETLIDLFLTISAFKRSSPVEVNVILPYFAYSRQTAYTNPHRKSVFAADIASLLETAGADKIFTVNLHAKQIHGYFNVPLLDIDASGLCASYFKKRSFKELVLVCSNDRLFGQAVKIQANLARAGHNVKLGILVEQQIDQNTRKKKLNYIGYPVQGRDVLIIDNIIDTGKTVEDATECLDKLGAREMYMFAVHGIFTGDAVERINNSHLKELVVTNTLPLHMTKMSPKINQISIAPMLADTICQAAFNLNLEQLKKGAPININHN